jgi:hypothetical protein
MCVFFSRSRDMARVVAGCDTRGRVLKRKALQLSDAVRTRSWLWPSTNRLRAPPLPLSLYPTVTCAAAVMMTPSCRAPQALHQEAKLTLNNSHCTALPTLTTSPLPRHHLQAPSRLLITTPQSQSTRQADSRGHYAVQPGSLYPSPLSHPPLQSQGLNHAPSSSLPPLPQVLNHRASPILSSASSDSALELRCPGLV